MLNHLLASPSGRQLGELASAMKLPKSTVHQILVALHKTGMVEQDERTRAYRLGYKVLHLSAAYLSGLSIVERALPHMRRLRDQSGETVVLSRRIKDQRVDIAVIESPGEIRRAAEVGRLLPLHVGAVGKIILAFMPASEARAILERTGQAPESIEAKLQECRQVAQLGYAVSIGERVPGAWSVAAPILDWSNELSAVLALSGPLTRFSPEQPDRFARLVSETASRISWELGATRRTPIAGQTSVVSKGETLMVSNGPA